MILAKIDMKNNEKKKEITTSLFYVIKSLEVFIFV